jgi:hypothetical protein
MTAIPQLFDRIIEEGGKGGSLAVKWKIQTVDKDGKPRDPLAIMGDIIKATKGNQAKLSEMGFGGESLQTLLAMAKPYNEELRRAGGDTKSAGAALDRALGEVAKGSMKWTDLQKDLAEELASPEAKIQASMERMAQAMSDPKMLAAIDKLASHLPSLAKMLADVTSFAVDNPVKAGMAVVGGTYAKGAIEGIITAAITGGMSKGGTSAAAAMQGGIAAGGSTAAGLMGAAVAVAVAAALVQWQYEALKKETDVDIVDSTGKKTGKADVWGEGWAKLKNDLGVTSDEEYAKERGFSLGGYDEAREGVKLSIDKDGREWMEARPGGRLTNERYQLGAGTPGAPGADGSSATGMGAYEAGAERAYQSEVDAITRQEDEEWSSYAKSIGADSATLDRRGGVGGQGQQQASKLDPGQLALLASMIAQQELKTRITNPEAMRGPSGPTTPRPGNGNFP